MDKFSILFCTSASAQKRQDIKEMFRSFHLSAYTLYMNMRAAKRRTRTNKCLGTFLLGDEDRVERTGPQPYSELVFQNPSGIPEALERMGAASER